MSFVNDADVRPFPLKFTITSLLSAIYAAHRRLTETHHKLSFNM